MPNDSNNSKINQEAQPIQPPSRTWKHLGMDLICDLPVSSEGFKHVLVTVCYLSKFVVVRPLKREPSEEVIQNLQDIYATMGLPDIIQHDKGPEFTSSLFQEFHCKLHIDNRSTRAYHPMANGFVEAHNKILKTKLTKIEVQTGNHCSQLLKLACLTMNSTKKSHGQTPFNVMWGWESKLLSTYPNLAIDPIEDFEQEDAIFREILSQQSENDYIDDQDEFSPPSSEPGEELS
ncbi:hypothetical protein LOD99_3950 [Oopsacas minuta]|uniref:Integrase catalytic domain-containing protein n=1 Tax=Oopsacas minuta TaxID=111878 RepID=A0AAV7JW06_9METZ|nr:hypothetical protein LOD99_3950 [Oopsacas minuta]